MTETRIRWEDNERRWDDSGSILGYVGTRSEWMFQIGEANDDADDEELMLTVAFPGTHQAASIGSGVSPLGLKAEAERWLEESTASIGAVFPGAHCSECGFTVPRHDHDKSCSHYRDTAAPGAGKD